MFPVLGTCLSLVLADKSTNIVFRLYLRCQESDRILIFLVRKRYSRRKNLQESLLDDCIDLGRIRLLRQRTENLIQFKDIKEETTVNMDPTDDENHSVQHDNSGASGGAEVSQEESNEKDDTKLELLKDTEETTNSDIKDMPPSYSGLLSEPANSLPCYKVVSNPLIRY